MAAVICRWRRAAIWPSSQHHLVHCGSVTCQAVSQAASRRRPSTAWTSRPAHSRMRPTARGGEHGGPCHLAPHFAAAGAASGRWSRPAMSTHIITGKAPPGTCGGAAYACEAGRPGALASLARWRTRRWPQAYSRRVLEDAGNNQRFSRAVRAVIPVPVPARVPAGAAATAGVLMAVPTVRPRSGRRPRRRRRRPRPWRRLRVRDRRWFGWFRRRRFRRYRHRRSGIVGCFTGGRYGRAGELCWHLDMIPPTAGYPARRRAPMKRPWRNATPGA